MLFFLLFVCLFWTHVWSDYFSNLVKITLIQNIFHELKTVIHTYCFSGEFLSMFGYFIRKQLYRICLKNQHTNNIFVQIIYTCMIHGWYCANRPIVQDIRPLSLLLKWFWVSVPLLEAPWLGFKPQMESPVFTAVPYYFLFHFTHRDLHSGTWIRGIKRRGKKAEIQWI